MVDIMDQHRSRLADLEAEQFSFVKKSCAVMREKSKLSFPSVHASHAWSFLSIWKSLVKKEMSANCETGKEFEQFANWDDELYWVCRMFDKDWSAGKAFKS